MLLVNDVLHILNDLSLIVSLILRDSSLLFFNILCLFFDGQEVTQKIMEAVAAVAGSSLEQTSWLSRNLEVKAQPQICLQEDEDEPESSEFYG